MADEGLKGPAGLVKVCLKRAAWLLGIDQGQLGS